jgi:4-hydroxythreonine-4-phosphate dehydrogenase
LVWQHATAPPSPHVILHGNQVKASPALVGGRALLGNYSGQWLSLPITGGKPHWTAKGRLTFASPATDGPRVVMADLAGITTRPVMMLACDELKVVPISVHESLAAAVQGLKLEDIVTAGEITALALGRDFAIGRPRLAVAGLNPHAGEGGAMGREEIDIIAPAIARLGEAGVDAFGPVSPDALFTADARASYDAALCMYHDQALIPIKTLDFDGAVNVTLGLPFVRTSPDHGTGFDIAGRGRARPSSLIAALKLADRMAACRDAGA